MVSRKNRPQADVNYGNLGLRTYQATDVPFIPATRRSGVGDNEQAMGSALARLGSALGSLGGTISAQTEEERRRDYHAGNRRHEEFIHSTSKHTPEQRVEIRSAFGEHPVADGLKQITDVREKVIPKLQGHLKEQIESWQANGWTHVTTDEDGAEVRTKITDDFLKNYFQELVTSQAYDVYYEADGKGGWKIDPRSETGRLRDPQVSTIKGMLDGTRDKVLGALREYRTKELWKDSYEVTESNAQDALAGAYAKGLRGQGLLDTWMDSGRATFSAVLGKEVASKATRDEVFKAQLRGFGRKMATPGDAKVFIGMLDARLKNPDGTYGPTLRHAYPQEVQRLQKQADEILNRVIETEYREGTDHEILTKIVTQNGHHSFETKTLSLPNGETITYTAKDQKAAVIAKIKQAAKIVADPEKPHQVRQQTLSALAGTGLVDDEIKDLFSAANFGAAAASESDMNQLLTTYRDIKLISPTLLNRYVTDPKVRARLANMERITRSYPRLGVEGALRVVQGAVDEEGNPPAFESEESKYWKAQTGATSFRKKGFNGNELEDLELTLRLRMADPNERRKIAGDDGMVSASEFKAAFEDEVRRAEAGRVMVDGVPVRAPRPDIDPQQYAGKVEAFKNQIVKQFKLDPKNVRLNVLPFNQGFLFTDQDGIPLELEFESGKAKAIYGHQDIISWSQREGNAALDAKATRAGGLSIIKGTHAESLKKIEESRKVITDTTSWWSQLWGKK